MSQKYLIIDEITNSEKTIKIFSLFKGNKKELKYKISNSFDTIRVDGIVVSKERLYDLISKAQETNQIEFKNLKQQQKDSIDIIHYISAYI